MGKITLRLSYTIRFFLFGIGLVVFLNTADYVYSEQVLRKEFLSVLIENASLKTASVNRELAAIADDMYVIASLPQTKALLREPLVESEVAIKRDVDERARVISLEATNYLRGHPEMTLADLQNDTYFNDLVVQHINGLNTDFTDVIVQPVGSEGYSFAFDTHTLINYFHKEPRRVGYDYHEMREEFPDTWKLFEEVSKNGVAEGFYHRDEPGGEVTYKYAKFVELPVTTADGVSISLGATAYVSDYQTIATSSTLISTLNNEHDYVNILLISPEGRIVYAVDETEDFGTGLTWEVNERKGVTQQYKEVSKTKEASFYGPFMGSYGDIYPKLSLMSPVYDDDVLLGYAAIIDDMEDLFEVVRDAKGLGETGQTYLVNPDHVLISPLRDHRFDILVQSVNTDNVNDCLGDLESFQTEQGGVVEEHEEGSVFFLNYRGDFVLGTHAYVPAVDWCLLAEVNQEELGDILFSKHIQRNVVISLIILLIMPFIGYFARRVYCRFSKDKVCSM